MTPANRFYSQYDNCFLSGVTNATEKVRGGGFPMSASKLLFIPNRVNIILG